MSESIMPTGLETVLCEVSEGVATVTLNRPEVLNAFNELMQDELRAVWRWSREDDDVRVVVLTGAGEKAFCTGIAAATFRRRSTTPSPTRIPAARSVPRVRSCGSR
jgi:enoyl-CoA hydratase/carnithine racemase